MEERRYLVSLCSFWWHFTHIVLVGFRILFILISWRFKEECLGFSWLKQVLLFFFLIGKCSAPALTWNCNWMLTELLGSHSAAPYWTKLTQPHSIIRHALQTRDVCYDLFDAGGGWVPVTEASGFWPLCMAHWNASDFLLSPQLCPFSFN